MQKRFGLILASTHTGSSNGLWASIANAVEESGDSLYVFPGGRLGSLHEFEYLRNSIFQFVNTDNLDGLISWGSSLGGTVSVEDVIAFHQKFESLPIITIALKLPGHPNIAFDAYEGVKSLVQHFIQIHGSRKIAFIRGPLNHASSEARFKAYLDTLAEAGIPLDSALVSPPSPWNEGEAALIQLCEGRQLVPGRDFDTLVCASDLLMFTAARLLQKKGYRIPDDLRIAGFNDSPESRFLSVPGTTVRVPFADMGRCAFSMLCDLVQNQTMVGDCLKPARLVIRNSCGCGYRGNAMDQAMVPFGRQDFRDWVMQTYSLDAQQDQAWLDPLLEAVYRGARQKSLSQFSTLLQRILERYYERDPDPTIFQTVMANLERLSDLPLDFRQEMINLCWSMSLDAHSRITNVRTYESIRRSNILNSFKCDLLRAWDKAAIPKIMQEHLPSLGVDQAFLVMMEDDAYSRYVGGYTQKGMTGYSNEVFPARVLLPAEVSSFCGPGVYLVQPLFIENQVLGYMVSRISDRDGLMHEELRSSVSSALKGILLFEETIHAKEVAEQAERAKMDFFATMGDGLKEPLATILDRMNQLDTMIQERSRLPKSLCEAIDSVRNEMEAQLAKTSVLFDYTLAKSGSLEMDVRLFSLSSCLSSLAREHGLGYDRPQVLPLVQGDPNRLRQVFELLIGHLDAVQNDGNQMKVFLEPKGLRVVFHCTKGISPWPEGDTSLSLAHSIVLLHHGGFYSTDQDFNVFLPWPTIGGIPTLHERGTPRRLLVVANGPEVDSLCQELANNHHLELSHVLNKGLITNVHEVGEDSVLFWDSRFAGIEQYIAMKLLHQHERLFRVPVICFGDTLEGKTLVEAVNTFIRRKNSGPLVFWGLSPADFPLFAGIDEIHHIDADERFSLLSLDGRPSVVVLDSVDLQRISMIRTPKETAQVPIVVLVEHFPQEHVMQEFCAVPLVVACHASVAASPEFATRMRDLAGGGDILPPHTGALVKRALVYLEHHGTGLVSRWKLADSVNVSEDYLTRIFRKELGMSPWEYLNRYRIQLACELLVHTDLSLSAIASRIGFQDQAYFCRVFKKLKGCTPSALRNP